MRFQIFILLGLAFAYATGAYYTNTKPTDIASAAAFHQAVSTDVSSSRFQTNASFTPLQTHALRDGDIVFNTSNSTQSKAIQYATKSKYSHCGIVFFENGKPFVYEAVQPVKKTPLAEWTADHYVAKRLKNADDVLTPEVLQKMKAEAKRFHGKNYDLYFNWSDDQLYCSELVYKIYERGAGLKVGELKKLKDYDLSNALVQEQLKQRYGKDIPYDEQMISPGAIFESDLLSTVSIR